MSRPRHQDGWITEKAGNYYGHFSRYILDPISGEKKRKHEAVVLSSKSAMRKWEAKAKLKGIIADELGSEQSITRPDPERSSYASTQASANNSRLPLGTTKMLLGNWTRRNEHSESWLKVILGSKNLRLWT